MDNNTDFHERIMTVLRVAIAIIATAILIMMVGGCSSQWHVQRAVIKDPSILTQGTSVDYFDTVKVVVNEYHLVDSIVFTYDTNMVDSINIINENITQEVASRIRKRIIDAYNLQLESDTAVVDTFKISAFAYFKDGKLFVEFSQFNDTTIAIEQGKIECPHQVKHTPLTWWQKNKWRIFVLAIGTAAFFIMRKHTNLLKI